MTTMTEIRTSLAALEELMGEKGIVTPTTDYTVKSSGREYVYLSAKYESKPFDGKDFIIIRGNSEVEVIDAAFAYIRAMPEPAQAAKQAWQKSLGKVIDEGHALNLPDEVMQPLRQGSQAMTENLLAGPGVAA